MPSTRPLRAVLAVALPWLGLLAVLPNCQPAASHPEVLVVVNGASPLSVATGQYYAQVRGVPAANVLTLSYALPDPALGATGPETTNTTRFDAEIRGPIEDFLIANDLVEQVEIIVLAPGIPHRLAYGNCPLDAFYLRDCPNASVDAELAVLFSNLVGAGGLGANGEAANPYFASPLPFAEWRAANPTAPLRYLVARLAGYQTPVDAATGVPTDVRYLIDRAREHVAGGGALIDEDPSRPDNLEPGNALMLHPAAGALGALGLPLQHDETNTFVSNAAGLVAYGSWGSNDGNDAGAPFYGSIGGLVYPGSFLPQSVAIDIVSTNARSFVSPPTYGQSLVADLVRRGVAGAAGNVFEPLLSGVARPEILFPAYFRGAPAIEAHYRAVPYLSWQNVWVGDPLMTYLTPRPPTSDFDGDGVPDGSDNCIVVPNANQRDSNGDGYGNPCDADVNNDGRVTTSWGVVSPVSARGDLEQVQISASGGPYNAHHDFDGDGDVDAFDASAAGLMIFLPPGPSGLVP